MLRIEVARTNDNPGSLLRASQPAFLSIYVAGSQEDYHLLQTVLSRASSSGEHACMPAEMRGSRCNLFVFRTSTLLSAVVTDSGLIVCGDANALQDVRRAAEMCCCSDAAAGFHRHLEFGDPNGLGSWPLGNLTISTLQSSNPPATAT